MLRANRGARASIGAATSRRVAHATRSLVLVIALASSAIASSASAQAEPSAADRQAASEAYDRGTSAYLAHEYARAAQLFETAYRLAPNSAALIQAIRSYDRAGDRVRAGSLALRLQARHAGDRQAERQAETTLRTASHDFLRIDVACDADCTVELDGRLADHTSFFVDPSVTHSVRASFDTGAAPAQDTHGAAGETQSMSFERPAPLPEPEHVASETEDEDAPREVIVVQAPPPNQGGLPLPVFISAAGLTAVAGGILIWSGVDTLDGLPAYRANPTEAGLSDGQSRELRTNVLVGVTSALAVATLVIGILTDWDGDPAPETDVAVTAMASPEGGNVSITGRF